jgi:hypothetical protein
MKLHMGALFLITVILAILAIMLTQEGDAKVPAARVAAWTATAVCESGSDPPGWRDGGPGWTWSGGLRMARSTWRWWAGELRIGKRTILSLYPLPEDAPALVQIRVADYGNRVHGGYWGCPHP